MERAGLAQLHQTSELEWFLARSWSKNSGLVELPRSAANVRTTKELLEEGMFDRTGKDKEWAIVLVARKRNPRTDLESPPIKQEIKQEIKREIKKEPHIKTEKSNARNQSHKSRLPIQVPQTPTPRTQAPSRTSMSDTSTPKRSRADVSSGSSDQLPENVFQYYEEKNHTSTRNSIRTERTESNTSDSNTPESVTFFSTRDRTQSVLPTRGKSKPTSSNRGRTKASNPPRSTSHVSPAVSRSEDSEALTGRTRRQTRAINDILGSQTRQAEE